MATAKDLLAAVENMSKLRVLVVGDGIHDIYHFGRATRLCPEAPVPVFVTDRIETRLGGALNCAAQVAALAQRVEQFVPANPSIKHRYMANGHLLLRVDADVTLPPHVDAIAGLERMLKSAAADEEAPTPDTWGYDAIVISDYGKGWVTDQVCRLVIEHGTTHGIPVIVDPKGKRWAKYSGATMLCPNTAEIEEWIGDVCMLNTMIEKCGPRGLSWRRDPNDRSKDVLFPARAPAVVDVTGAGDTVVAIVAAAAGVGAPMEVICELANLAAGYVVSQPGTVICPRERLIERIIDFHGAKQ